MPEDRPDEISKDDRLDQVLAEYLQAIDAGREPDREEFLARYPRFALEMREFFENQSLFERAARPWVPVSNDVPTADASTQAGTTAVVAGTHLPYFGDYELLEEIARGGMGIVYKARQISLNRVVAVKMILAGEFASAADVQRFRIEAENAANLEHPNIVPIYEVGQYKGHHYYSMKLVEGGRLAQQIPRFTNDHRAAARLMATVAHAVHYAHQHGILHRDLKPGNILLDAVGEPQVTDLGLARRLTADSHLTLAGTIVGTPCYMAPEQARSEKELTTAVDIYSLGAILYELLTGQPPFRADTVLETLGQVREREPLRLSSVNPRVRRDLETICLKCLQKDPQKRYGSAKDLADDLGHWLKDEPILARPARTAERTLKWIRRHPAAAAVAGTGLVAVLAVVALAVALPYAWRLKEARRKTEESWRNTQQALTREAAARAEADGLLKRSEAYFYAAHILAADRELQDHHNDRAIELLEACREPLRRWEWYYLNRLCHDEAQSFAVDPSGVSSIALGPDGTKLVAVTGNGTLRVLDLASGKVGSEIHVAHGVATCIAWQPAKGMWAVGDSEGGVSLWNASTAVQKWRLQPHMGRVNCIACSVNGDQIASGGDDARVALCDSLGDKSPAILREHTSSVNCICFSRNGRWIASGAGRRSGSERPSGGEAIVWELASTGSTGPDAATPNTATSKPVAARVALTCWKNTQIASIAFAPDCESVVAGCADGKIRSWDVRSDSPMPDIGHHDDKITALVYDRSAGRLFSASGHTVQAVTGEAWYGHRREVLSLAYDGKTGCVLAGGADGTVKSWLPGVLPVAMRLLPYGDSMRDRGQDDAEFTPDGKRLALSAGDLLVFLSITTGREVMRLEGAGGSRLRFDASGERLAVSGKGGPQLYDAVTGKLLRRFTLPTIPKEYNQAYNQFTVAISRDGKQVAAAENKVSRTVFVWDADTGVRLASIPQRSYVWDLAFSPNGRMLVTAGGNYLQGGPRRRLGGIPGDVTLWDIATGKMIREFDGSRFCNWAVDFSLDGRFIAAGGGNYQGGGGGFNVWDATSGREVLSQSHPNCVFRVTFSPDGSRLAVSGGVRMVPMDGGVKIWDLATGVEMLSLKDASGSITGLTFSPDDRRFAASSTHGIYLWDGTSSALVTSGPDTRQTKTPFPAE
jgi:WD40 repeat protein